MKDGSLLMYYIMKEIPEEINEKLNIVVVFNPDEEIGSIYSRNVYADYAKRTKYAFVYEGASRGGLSDANILASYGCICLDGLGPASGGGGHSLTEKTQYKTAEHFKNLSLFLMKDIADNK